MFDWIKKLSGGNKPAEAPAFRQTRVVKKIIPASQRDSQLIEVETPAAPPAPMVRAANRTGFISLSTAATKPSIPAPVALAPKDPELLRKSEPVELPSPIRKSPVVRLAPPEEVVQAEPVKLTPAVRKPAIKLEMPGTTVAAHKEIVLCVGDFLDRIPAHFVNESAAKASDEVRFDAADLYSDMTKGRATIPLSIICEALPALFKRALSPEEDIEIQLPLPKIVAQMGDLLTRHDQEQPEDFEEVETPFLKAAQRDQEIHKVSGAVAAPARPAPPAGFSPAASAPAPAPAPAPVAAPARPKPPALSLGETDNEIKIALPVVKSVAPKKSSRRVTVRVRPLIQAMPVEQRDALMSSIPEDSQVDLPLDEIEDQLPSGRVFLSLATFSAALDSSIRTKFNESFIGSDVPISLSEIVRNLPKESFNLREDQMEQEVNPNEFATPFNTTPDTISTKPITRPIITPTAPPARPRTGAIANYTTRKLNSTGGKFPSPMHAALGTQEPLDAKKVVKLATSLPGVASLTIITADGLSLADNLPTFMDPEGFSAMAPQLHRKLAAHASDMKLGELRHLSLSTDAHTVTIFTGDGMTIAVLHQNQSDLGHGVREKFVAIVDGLAKQYAPELAAAH